MDFQAYIGLGSNLGNPVENCEQAIHQLDEFPHIRVTCRSPFYETEPVGVRNQNWFVNAVVHVHTSLEPGDLLSALMNIEKKMGRQRKEKWGPRIIDLDLLLFEDRVFRSGTLELPHPEMIRRRFVLAPLCDIARNLVHPVEQKTIGELLSALPSAPRVQRIPTSV